MHRCVPRIFFRLHLTVPYNPVGNRVETLNIEYILASKIKVKQYDIHFTLQPPAVIVAALCAQVRHQPSSYKPPHDFSADR